MTSRNLKVLGVNLILCGRAGRRLVALELLEVAQWLGNPNRWATAEQLNNPSLINAKRCRGVSAPRAPPRVLNCVNPPALGTAHWRSLLCARPQSQEDVRLHMEKDSK